MPDAQSFLDAPQAICHRATDRIREIDCLLRVPALRLHLRGEIDLDLAHAAILTYSGGPHLFEQAQHGRVV